MFALKRVWYNITILCNPPRVDLFGDTIKGKIHITLNGRARTRPFTTYRSNFSMKNLHILNIRRKTLLKNTINRKAQKTIVHLECVKSQNCDKYLHILELQ